MLLLAYPVLIPGGIHRAPVNSWLDGTCCLLQICITPSSNTYISFLLLGNIARNIHDYCITVLHDYCILVRTHLTDPKTTYFKQISLQLIHEYWNLEAKVCLSLHGPFLCLKSSLLLRLPSYLLSFHIKGDFNSQTVLIGKSPLYFAGCSRHLFLSSQIHSFPF